MSNLKKPRPAPEAEHTPITVDDRPAQGAHGLEEYEEILPHPEPAHGGAGGGRQ